MIKLEKKKRDYTLTLIIMTLLVLYLGRANGQSRNTMSPRQNKALTDFNVTKPIFKLNKEQLKNTYRHLRFFVISGYKEGIEPINDFISFANTVDTANGSTRIYMINLSIQDLLAFGIVQPSNRFLFEVKDISRYRYSSDFGSKIEWMRKNAYCFEYLRPIGVKIDINVLKNDIAHYFGVTVNNEIHKVDVLVLVRTSDVDKIKSKGLADSQIKGIMKNVPIGTMSRIIDSMELPRMIDETGYIGMVDMNLDISITESLPKLRKALRKYDLDLKEEKREMEMIVVREKDN